MFDAKIPHFPLRKTSDDRISDLASRPLAGFRELHGMAQVQHGHIAHRNELHVLQVIIAWDHTGESTPSICVTM